MGLYGAVCGCVYVFVYVYVYVCVYVFVYVCVYVYVYVFGFETWRQVANGKRQKIKDKNNLENDKK